MHKVMLLYIKNLFLLLIFPCIALKSFACQHNYIPLNNITYNPKETHYKTSIITILQESCIFPEHLRTLEVDGVTLTHFFARNGSLATALGTSTDVQNAFETFTKHNSLTNKEVSLIHLKSGGNAKDIFRPVQKFELASFDPPYVQNLHDNQFDIIFLTNIESLLRRGIKLQDLQNLMESLVSKTKMFFIELPEKSSPIHHLIPDPLLIFKKCSPHISVKKISTYGNNSLYFVLITKAVNIQGKQVIFDKIIEFRPASFRVLYRKDNYLLKEQLLDTGRYKIPWLEREMLNEIAIMKSFEGHDYGKVTHHIFSQVTKNSIQLVIPFIKNTVSLQRKLSDLSKKNQYTIIRSLLKTLVNFEENGLTHHDMSVRNLLYHLNTGEVTVIDFARAAKDDTRRQISMYGWVDKWTKSAERSRTPVRPVSDILLAEFLNVCWELYNKDLLDFDKNIMKSEPVLDVNEYGIFKNIAWMVLNKKVTTCKELLDYVDSHPL